MNQHILSIAARNQPEVMERILRVVRHRGFRLVSVSMAAVTNLSHITIRITVLSQRPVSLLITQLGKLIDVTDVCIQRATTQIDAQGKQEKNDNE